MSKIRFEYQIYQRPFVSPIITSHGEWKIREGIILRLESAQGKIGWGEIAPLPWFGSENLEEAIAFCEEIKTKEITTEIINQIPHNLTACQFGLASALEELLHPILLNTKNLHYSYLLPAGEKALSFAETHPKERETTFKWKIGVDSLKTELEIFKQLREIITPGKLRLDANGGLNIAEAETWLATADNLGGVEFIEQPLPPPQLLTMLKLAEKYHTAIALDESVATSTQLETCYQRGWRGIYVIKPSIFGFPDSLRQLCAKYSLDLVFSTVFETEIGRRGILRLALELGNSQRALGFGAAYRLL